MPLVIKTIGRLKREGLAVAKPYRGVFLTEPGETLADRVRSRHRVVVDLLLAVGVPAESAELDAEGIEHHVSDMTLAALPGSWVQKKDSEFRETGWEAQPSRGWGFPATLLGHIAVLATLNDGQTLQLHPAKFGFGFQSGFNRCAGNIGNRRNHSRIVRQLPDRCLPSVPIRLVTIPAEGGSPRVWECRALLFAASLSLSARYDSS